GGGGGAAVPIGVAAVGTEGTAQVLREALSLGVDGVRVVLAEEEGVTPASAAAALAAVLGTETAFDLVLGGAGADGDEGLLTRLTAEALSVPFAGTTPRLEIQPNAQKDAVVLAGDGTQRERVRALPAAVAVAAGAPLREYTVQGYLSGLGRTVEVHRWPRGVAAQAVAFIGEKRAAAATATEERPHALPPQDAGRLVLAEIGLGGPQQ